MCMHPYPLALVKEAFLDGYKCGKKRITDPCMLLKVDLLCTRCQSVMALCVMCFNTSRYDLFIRMLIHSMIRGSKFDHG